jgi:hypothetical protein
VFIDILLKRCFDSGQPNARWLARTILAHRVISEKRHHGDDIAPVSGIDGLTEYCNGVGLSEPHPWEHGNNRSEEYN